MVVVVVVLGGRLVGVAGEFWSGRATHNGTALLVAAPPQHPIDRSAGEHDRRLWPYRGIIQLILYTNGVSSINRRCRFLVLALLLLLLIWYHGTTW